MDERPSNHAEPLMTAEQVAERLSVSEGTVNQWVKSGRIPVVKVGKLNRFRREDIETWIDERARESSPAPQPAA